jgi:hypothetical protein
MGRERFVGGTAASGHPAGTFLKRQTHVLEFRANIVLPAPLGYFPVMAKKGTRATSSIQPATPTPAVHAGKPSALLDTRVVYCGDNLEQLAKLPDGCVDSVPADHFVPVRRTVSGYAYPT